MPSTPLSSDTSPHHLFLFLLPSNIAALSLSHVSHRQEPAFLSKERPLLILHTPSPSPIPQWRESSSTGPSQLHSSRDVIKCLKESDHGLVSPECVQCTPGLTYTKSPGSARGMVTLPWNLCSHLPIFSLNVRIIHRKLVLALQMLQSPGLLIHWGTFPHKRAEAQDLLSSDVWTPLKSLWDSHGLHPYVPQNAHDRRQKYGGIKASKHSSLKYSCASALEPFKERVTFTSVSPEQISVVHEPREEDELPSLLPRKGSTAPAPTETSLLPQLPTKESNFCKVRGQVNGQGSKMLLDMCERLQPQTPAWCNTRTGAVRHLLPSAPSYQKLPLFRVNV